MAEKAFVPQPSDDQRRVEWLKSLTPHQRAVASQFIGGWGWSPELLERAKDEHETHIDYMFGPTQGH